MTITTRSKRTSIFTTNVPTPATVGPGSYAPERAATSFRDERKPLFSGFATSDKRNLNANKTTSAITPGPGAYLSENNNAPAPLSNVFATKISRFAPSAPGSTIFLPSSVQQNPGPGSYMPIDMETRGKITPLHMRASTSPTSNNQLEERATNKFAHLIKPSVPTIPRKEQSYGYVQVGNDLRLQGQPNNIYSGIGQDTVGPAAYNDHKQIWDEKKNAAASIKSTVKREVWEELSPRVDVPGPGAYGPVSATMVSGILPTRPLGKGGVRQCAVFASKVPILPDPRRIVRDEEREQELQAKEERLQRNKEKHKNNVIRAKVEAFGSTTNRRELSSHISAPFSNPTFVTNPGPGRYNDPTVSAPRHGKRHKKRFSDPNDDGIGFSAASERYCMTKLKITGAPGPGTYNSETPRTLERQVKAKQSVGRHGIFGTTSQRRVWDQLERAEPEEVPGPGAYDKQIDPTGGHYPLAASSAAFKSSSSRFTKRGNPNAPPHVYCVGDQTAPAVGQYDVGGTLLVGAAGAGSPTTRNPLVVPLAERAPFMTKEERAVFDPKELKEVPGPGAYTLGVDGTGKALTRSSAVRSTLSNDERFRVKPTVPPAVGPGLYAIPGTVGTKSFNVTMAPKDNVVPHVPRLRPRGGGWISKQSSSNPADE